MQISMEVLITADILLTQNQSRAVINNGAVGIANGKVVFIGEKRKTAHLQATKRLDLGNVILMPGLINAHVHASMTMMRGIADDLPLMQWLAQHIFPVEKYLTQDVVYLGALLGCAEMIRTGTTSFSDMYLIEDGVCLAAEKSGMKCLAGEGVFSFPSPAYSDPLKALDVAEAGINKWAGHKTVRMSVAPHAVYTTNPKLMQKCAELAKRYGLVLHTHMAETRTETEMCLQNFQKRPVDYLHSLGVLGPSCTVAHAVDLTAQEMGILAETGTSVVHCPKSNLKLASGVARVPAMLHEGVSLALGTDGAASNNMLNMFSEMNMCALLHKAVNYDPTLMSAQTVLDMATIGGAKALGWDGLGCIEEGGPADLIALDLNFPNLSPVYNPVSHVVYAASGHEVCFSMIDGQIVYDQGQFKTIDYESLGKEIIKLKRWVLEKAGN